MESHLSGIGDRYFHPCVWYQRAFDIPAKWEGRCVRLNFGAVDYRATVWVNGTVVAWHEGGHTPFSCDITGALSEGNVLWCAPRTLPPTATSRAVNSIGNQGRQHLLRAHDRHLADGMAGTGITEPSRIDSYYAFRGGIVSVTAKISVPGQAQFVSMSISDDTRALASAMSLADGPGALYPLRSRSRSFGRPITPSLHPAPRIARAGRFARCRRQLFRSALDCCAGRQGSAQR